jgi:manganese efflux pump family protein
LAIVALILWVLTAGAGAYMLVAGNAARRLAAGPGRIVSTPDGSATGLVTDGGGPPPIPRTKVHSPPGEHPLLEFSHPALGAIGLACWFVFVGLRYRPLAWISFGILVLTVAAGLSWLASNARAARQRGAGARAAFPLRLITLHGLAATLTVVLVVLTALSASHS